jgi:hypothetical protein
LTSDEVDRYEPAPGYPTVNLWTPAGTRSPSALLITSTGGFQQTQEQQPRTVDNTLPPSLGHPPPSQPPLHTQPSNGVHDTGRMAPFRPSPGYVSRQPSAAPSRRYNPLKHLRPSARGPTHIDTSTRPTCGIALQQPSSTNRTYELVDTWGQVAPDASRTSMATGMNQTATGSSDLRWVNEMEGQLYASFNQVMDYSASNLSAMSQPSGSSMAPAGLRPSSTPSNMLSPYGEAYPNSRYSISPSSPSPSGVRTYYQPSLSPISQPLGLSMVSAGVSPSPITPNMLSPYGEAYPTSRYPISPASLSPSGMSINYLPSPAYSLDALTQTPLSGAGAHMYLPPPCNPGPSSSTTSSHRDIAPRPPSDYIGSHVPIVPTTPSELGSMQIVCQWRDCSARIINTQPDEIKQRVRLHFKHERHTDDYILHDSICQWAGCKCSCHRGTRCSTLGSDHPAHVKDIVHHVTTTHISY